VSLPASGAEAAHRARTAALRALELDSRLSEAHTVVASTHFQSWDWKNAERSFVRALELNPSNADAYGRYSIYLSGMRRHDEALEAVRKARRLDPLSPPLRLLAVHQSYLALHGHPRFQRLLVRLGLADV